jgi:hypothetical protein
MIPHPLRSLARHAAAFALAGCTLAAPGADAKSATVERENAQVAPGTPAGKRPFGLIRVTGPGNDRRIALEIYGSNGTRPWRHELRAADLRFVRVKRVAP